MIKKRIISNVVFSFCLYLSARRVIRCSFHLFDTIFPLFLLFLGAPPSLAPCPGLFYRPTCLPRSLVEFLLCSKYITFYFVVSFTSEWPCLLSNICWSAGENMALPISRTSAPLPAPNHPFPFLGHSILISLQCLKRTRTAT